MGGDSALCLAQRIQLRHSRTELILAPSSVPQFPTYFLKKYKTGTLREEELVLYTSPM